MSIFQLALEAWRGGEDMRRRRRRYKKFTFGRQWEDEVRGLDGKFYQESALARENGQRPLTNNLIRQLVKCVVGNFRNLADGDDSAAGNAPDADTQRRNSLFELDCRMLEEFLISGCAIQRVVDEKRMQGTGVWVDNVSPDDFFVNRYRDPRGHDIELVGMLHSMSLREVEMRFGRDEKRRRAIVEAYGSGMAACGEQLGAPSAGHFFRGVAGRCRVIEVWTLESRNLLRCHNRSTGRFYIAEAGCEEGAAEEVDRVPFTTLRWRCRFFTPTGKVIEEYDSPYRHGCHPFAVKMYPLIDGEVHSLVEDIIDQQKHINRLITTIDHVMSTSAKGVLLFPNDQKLDNMDWPEIGRIWSSPNGVIPYDPRRSSGEPHQVVSQGEQSGAYRLLETQFGLFQQISGLTEALQGRLPQTNTSAALYESQLRSGVTALRDLLDSFNDFRIRRNELIRGI